MFKNDQGVSREALLRSLDSLEEICVKRLKNTRVIDDKQLPFFISDIQKALYEYARLHSIPGLAVAASKFPGKVVLWQIPLIAEIIYYSLIGFFLIGLVLGLGWLLLIFFPVMAVIVIAHAVVTMVFSYKRRATLMQIADVVDEAKEML
jgi:hypothetical protein